MLLTCKPIWFEGHGVTETGLFNGLYIKLNEVTLPDIGHNDHHGEQTDTADDRPFGWIYTTTTARANPALEVYYGHRIYPNSSVEVQLHLNKVLSNDSFIHSILLTTNKFVWFSHGFSMKMWTLGISRVRMKIATTSATAGSRVSPKRSSEGLDVDYLSWTYRTWSVLNIWDLFLFPFM